MVRKFLVPLLLVILCALTVLSHFISPKIEDHGRSHGYAWETYDSSYFSKYQSVRDIIDTADRHFMATEKNSLAYYNYIASIVRKRFYHGYSRYSMNDNPLAAIAGNLVWDHLSAIVIADDIMKHPMAACNQQALVLMEIFKRNGVNFRKVAFTKHYTVEAWIEGDWRYFDTDVEPNFHNRRTSLDNLLATKRFDTIYSVTGDLEAVKLATSVHSYGKANDNPAPRAEFFHRACYVLTSKSFLIISCMLVVLFGFEMRAVQQVYAWRLRFTR
ncbi:MAG TPA: hypothetical protein VNR87_09740 [Flavisolibacter sp.]|nr:hypothetical protein [Flavisolibacter sp.]